MTISGIIYPKCLKNEKDIKITKVGLEAEAAELEDAAAVSNAAIDEKQYIAIGR